MRKISIFILIIIFMAGCTTIGDIVYDQSDLTYVYELPGKTKQELYQESLKYIALNFVSVKAVLEYQNEEEGEIIGNGNTKYDGGWGEGIYSHELSFSMRVRTKDDKIQISFQNIRGSGTNGWFEQEYTTFTNDQYNNIKNRLKIFSNNMIIALKEQTFLDF